MVPAGVIYFFLWFVPPIDDKPPYVKYIYYQMLYLMFQASLTVRFVNNSNYCYSMSVSSSVSMFPILPSPCT